MTTLKRNAGFQGKEQYLQYRAAWKQEYAELSSTIRDIKFCRRFDYARGKLTEAGLERFKRVEKAHGTQWGFCPASLAVTLRAQAALMIEELKLSKATAQRQYLEAHKSLETKPVTA